MPVFNQLIIEIIHINTLSYKINSQKRFLIGEKKAIFGATNQVRIVVSY
jgi:hypothetical protein